jgi:hypothetical protein
MFCLVWDFENIFNHFYCFVQFGKEFKLNANGFNTIIEILNSTNCICQLDNCMLDECRNVFVEHIGPVVFQLTNSNVPHETSADLVYCQIIAYWISVLDDPKNQGSIASMSSVYIHALNTVKAMLMASGKAENREAREKSALI